MGSHQQQAHLLQLSTAQHARHDVTLRAAMSGQLHALLQRHAMLSGNPTARRQLGALRPDRTPRDDPERGLAFRPGQAAAANGGVRTQGRVRDSGRRSSPAALPQEWLNREIRRRTDVVGTFPDGSAVVRLISAVLAEQNDEWIEQRRYMGLEILGKARLHVIDGEPSEEVTSTAITA